MAHIQAAAIYREAVELHEDEKLEEAEVLYRRVLHIHPNNPDAAHCLGALLVELYGKKKYEEAVKLLKVAINQVPSNAKFRHTLGLIHEKCGNHKEAVDAFEYANEKDSLNVQTLMALGRNLKEVGRQGRAAEIYKAVTKLQPEHPSAHYKQANCLKYLGRKKEALAAFRRHLRLHPKDMQTRYWIAALKGDAQAMQAMPAELVSGLFDQYAEKFDKHLVEQLEYKTPRLISELLHEYVHLEKGSQQVLSFRPRHPFRRCVDLGCGTGLMGPYIRKLCTLIEGVDLSAGMVEKAKEKDVYDILQVADLVTYLKDGPMDFLLPDDAASDYDLFLAVDVFVYIGNLSPVLASSRAVANPWAINIFSVESLEAMNDRPIEVDEDGPSPSDAKPAGYVLCPTGRYTHSSDYIREVAEETGWSVAHIQDTVIRKNGGLPVQGHLCVLVPQGSPLLAQITAKYTHVHAPSEGAAHAAAVV